jgi:hypothetical protein
LSLELIDDNSKFWSAGAKIDDDDDGDGEGTKKRRGFFERALPEKKKVQKEESIQEGERSWRVWAFESSYPGCNAAKKRRQGPLLARCQGHGMAVGSGAHLPAETKLAQRARQGEGTS